VYDAEICLIDSGVQSSSEVIFDYLENSGRKPSDIGLLILTHAHPDHIGSAKVIMVRLIVFIAVHLLVVSCNNIVGIVKSTMRTGIAHVTS
jgi:metal-dependent hydrolase (beta-lactamase superfamily II)